MIKSKYFYMKKAYDRKGKVLGLIDDIVIDFFKGGILGFKISNNKIFSRKTFLSREKIVSIEEDIICLEVEKYRGLNFKEVKGMDVINLRGSNIGIVEDLIIKKDEYRILGLVITSGIVEKLFKGKRVILIEDCILGEEKIIVTASENVKVKIMRHGLGEI